MRYHHRIYDAPSGLSYAGLVEITALIPVSSRAQTGPDHGSNARIFKGQCVSSSPD